MVSTRRFLKRVASKFIKPSSKSSKAKATNALPNQKAPSLGPVDTKYDLFNSFVSSSGYFTPEAREKALQESVDYSDETLELPEESASSDGDGNLELANNAGVDHAADTSPGRAGMQPDCNVLLSQDGIMIIGGIQGVTEAVQEREIRQARKDEKATAVVKAKELRGQLEEQCKKAAIATENSERLQREIKEEKEKSAAVIDDCQRFQKKLEEEKQRSATTTDASQRVRMELEYEKEKYSAASQDVSVLQQVLEGEKDISKRALEDCQTRRSTALKEKDERYEEAVEQFNVELEEKRKQESTLRKVISIHKGDCEKLARELKEMRFRKSQLKENLGHAVTEGKEMRDDCEKAMQLLGRQTETLKSAMQQAEESWDNFEASKKDEDRLRNEVYYLRLTRGVDDSGVRSLMLRIDQLESELQASRAAARRWDEILDTERVAHRKAVKNAQTTYSWVVYLRDVYLNCLEANLDNDGVRQFVTLHTDAQAMAHQVQDLSGRVQQADTDFEAFARALKDATDETLRVQLDNASLRKQLANLHERSANTQAQLEGWSREVTAQRDAARRERDEARREVTEEEVT